MYFEELTDKSFSKFIEEAGCRIEGLKLSINDERLSKLVKAAILKVLERGTDFLDAYFCEEKEDENYEIGKNIYENIESHFIITAIPDGKSNCFPHYPTILGLNIINENLKQELLKAILPKVIYEEKENIEISNEKLLVYIINKAIDLCGGVDYKIGQVNGINESCNSVTLDLIILY